MHIIKSILTQEKAAKSLYNVRILRYQKHSFSEFNPTFGICYRMFQNVKFPISDPPISKNLIAMSNNCYFSTEQSYYFIGQIQYLTNQVQHGEKTMMRTFQRKISARNTSDALNTKSRRQHRWAQSHLNQRRAHIFPQLSFSIPPRLALL